MKWLKRIIITTFIFFVIGHFSLSSTDKWPDSFGDIRFYYHGNDVNIENCFEFDNIKVYFNRG